MRPDRRFRRPALITALAAGLALTPVLAAGPSVADAGSLSRTSAASLSPASAVSTTSSASAVPSATLLTNTTTVPGGLTAADLRISAKLSARATTKAVGRYFSGSVRDAETGQLIWRSKGDTGRLPASTAKLVTAVNALQTFGADHRFTTTVRQGPTPTSVVLVGAGDPSLSTADLTSLASQTVTGLSWPVLGVNNVVTVQVYVDDSLFPAPTSAPGWKKSYVPGSVRAVRALVVDGHHAADTSLDAARVFVARLKALGVEATVAGRTLADPTAPVLGLVQGRPLDAIVRRMMLVSDNDDAEALNRLVAQATGYPTTWTGARQAQRATLASAGVQLPDGRLFDGSGLSRRDRLTTNQVTAVLGVALDPTRPDLEVLRSDGLPLAGRTGTLTRSTGRFTTAPSKCAAGRVYAKTGTLGDTVTLAGWTTGADGRVKTFAFFVNHAKPTLALKRRVDALAATVTGCY